LQFMSAKKTLALEMTRLRAGGRNGEVLETEVHN
jgi:hypothetical protein